MRQPAVATTIVGVTAVEQLKLNLAASEIGLDADALPVLDTASRRPLGFPYRLSSDSSPQPARNRSPTIASLPSLIDEDPPPARLLTRQGR